MTFFTNGFLVVDLIDPSPVFEVRKKLTAKLQQLVQKEVELENYHEIITSEKEHYEIQHSLTEYFREQKFNQFLIKPQIPLFKPLIGGDILIQKRNYLRIAKPGEKRNNVGYHRDTYYGGSPYEISVVIPYVNLEAKSSLKVLPGSHIHPEKAYPTEQVIEKSVSKGSVKHNLGFLYAPKVMDPSIEEKMIPQPLKLGQALVFSLSIVHGCIVNQGKNTRWSSDIRLLNALAPVDLSSREDYYETLCKSEVTEAAEQYFLVNS